MLKVFTLVYCVDFLKLVGCVFYFVVGIMVVCWFLLVVRLWFAFIVDFVADLFGWICEI